MDNSIDNSSTNSSLHSDNTDAASAAVVDYERRESLQYSWSLVQRWNKQRLKDERSCKVLRINISTLKYTTFERQESLQIMATSSRCVP